MHHQLSEIHQGPGGRGGSPYRAGLLPSQLSLGNAGLGGAFDQEGQGLERGVESCKIEEVWLVNFFFFTFG